MQSALYAAASVLSAKYDAGLEELIINYLKQRVITQSSSALVSDILLEWSASIERILNSSAKSEPRRLPNQIQDSAAETVTILLQVEFAGNASTSVDALLSAWSILSVVNANFSASRKGIFLSEQIISDVVTGSSGLASLISFALETGDQDILLERFGMLPMLPLESLQTAASIIAVSSADKQIMMRNVSAMDNRTRISTLHFQDVDLTLDSQLSSLFAVSNIQFISTQNSQINLIVQQWLETPNKKKIIKIVEENTLLYLPQM
jgi:hypothetical protein